MKNLKLFGILIFCLYYQLTSLTNDFIMHSITDDFDNGMEIFSIDFDNDGDIDLLSAGADCTLWINEGSGNFSQTENLGVITGARSIRAADLDGDSDNDVVIADITANQVEILVNEGDSFNQYTLDSSLIKPHTIDLKDLDSDGDIDILCAEFDNSDSMSEVVWWENLGSGNFSEKNIISEIFQQSTFVVAAFFDSDEHMDVTACGELYGDVSWWHNDGTQNFGDELIVDTEIFGIHTLAASDLDLDGDIDILGASCLGGRIVWWENDGEGDFTRHNIAVLGGALWMDCADFDLDGDMDLFAVGQGPNCAILYENDGTQNFTAVPLEGFFADGFSATAADFDNDGDIDLAAIGRSSQQICWWENRYYAPNFTATQLTGNMPLTVNFIDQSNFIDPVTFWLWDFENDGFFDAFEQFPTHTYDEPGVYSVALTVEVGENEQQIIKENFIQVFNGHTALDFNNPESSVICPAESAPQIDGAFTIEAWIKPSDYGPINILGLGHIIDKSAVRIFIYEIYPQYPSNSITVEIEHEDGTISSSAAAGNSIVLDTWQHIAVTYDGLQEIEIYVNGIPMMEYQPIAPTQGVADNVDDPLILGNLAELTHNFTGAIDEIRLWDSCLSQYDIQNHMDNYLTGNETDLLSYWQMNEGNGNIIFDGTDNHNDGNISQAEWCPGMQLQMVPADDDIIEIPLKIELDNFPNPFNPSTTISLKLRPEDSKLYSGKETIPWQEQDSELTIHNLKGQKIKVLHFSQYELPSYSVTWDGTDYRDQPVTSGIYFARFKVGKETAVRKMILMK